jgi:hypothetical protein
MPFFDVHLFDCHFMLFGREKEAAFAAQIALIGDIINGAAYIQSGNLPVSFMPIGIQ